MKEENETFLERVSYAMFRYGLGLVISCLFSSIFYTYMVSYCL